MERLYFSESSKLGKRVINLLIKNTNGELKTYWINVLNGNENNISVAKDINLELEALGKIKFCE